MYCRRCGAQNDDNAYRCTRCGDFLHAAPGASMPLPPGGIPNYLAQSILVTLFCCLPLGIPAIVYAAQVNSKLQMGDTAGALDASRKARIFVGWSFGLGLIGSLLYVLLVAVSIIARS